MKNNIIQNTIPERTISPKEFPAIDVFKFIAAFLVVAIHLVPLASFESCTGISCAIQQCFTRIAVPFYFAAAGYFLFRKIEPECFDAGLFRVYILKVLRLLGIWYALLFAGSIIHLWYMAGLAIAVLFLGVLMHYRMPMKSMLILAIALYFIGLLGDSYYGLLSPLQSHWPIENVINAYEAVFGTTRNGIFMGFPFLLIGGVVERVSFSIKPSVAICGFIGSLAGLYYEFTLVTSAGLPRDYNMYICLLPTTFFLLLFAVNVNIKERAVYKKLRVVGVIVFFSHLFVYQWICWGASILRIDVSNSLIAYMLTIVIATLIGFLLEKLSRKDSLNSIKYLWS